MGPRLANSGRWFRRLAVAALILWAVYSCWALRCAQTASEQLRVSLRQWPAGSGPAAAARERALEAAGDLAQGRFLSAADALAPVPPPTAEERAAAAKFFARQPVLRTRLLALAGAARQAEGRGANVSTARDVLARAVRAAGKGDEPALTAELDRARTALDEMEGSAAGAAGPIDAAAVARWASALQPAWQLSQDLMTEGGVAAEKVLVLAARSSAEGRHADAVDRIRLAAELLGAGIAPGDQVDAADWFGRLAQRPIPAADQRRASAAIELAQAMAAAESPGETIPSMIQRARREFDSGEFAGAAWWAGAALNCLGMTDAAIAAATGPPDEEENRG